jgi:hypothetical protein
VGSVAVCGKVWVLRGPVGGFGELRFWLCTMSDSPATPTPLSAHPHASHTFDYTSTAKQPNTNCHGVQIPGIFHGTVGRASSRSWVHVL